MPFSRQGEKGRKLKTYIIEILVTVDKMNGRSWCHSNEIGIRVNWLGKKNLYSEFTSPTCHYDTAIHAFSIIESNFECWTERKMKFFFSRSETTKKQIYLL